MNPKSIFVLLALVTLFVPGFATETFKPADPNDPVPIQCQQGSGDVYTYIAWTQISGSRPATEDKPARVTGLVRVVIYGGAEALTIFTPRIRIDGQTDKMYSRLPYNVDFNCFPISVSEYPVHSGHKKIEILFDDNTTTRVPSPVADVKNVGVIGDTGCRNNKKQSCGEQKDWPFKTIAAQVAKEKPDLVLHMGDYRYSKVNCPGMTCADNWQNWLYEFFLPAKPLLDVAPIAFSRGNHESCNGGAGDGWFLLLQNQFSSNVNEITCKVKDEATYKYTKLWSFDTLAGEDKHRFFMLDSCNADDAKADNAGPFKTMADEVKAQCEKGGFKSATLVTHKPVWAAKKASQINLTLQTAFGDTLPKPITMAQGAHIHNHEVVTFAKDSGRVPQIVTGNSGVQINTTVKSGNHTIAGKEAQVEAGTQFGFDLWKQDPKSPSGWSIDLHKLTFKDGKPVWTKKKALSE